MAKRIKIGLLYQYNENWIGGTYYLQNIINALNALSPEEKPEILLFSDDASFASLSASINYPFLTKASYPSFSFVKKAANKISLLLFQKLLFEKALNSLSFIGLNPPDSLSVNQVYWIPDFQDKYYPNFFNETELTKRKEVHEFIQKNNRNVIFSSKSSQSDFNSFYPNSKGKQFVLPFAVTHPQYENLSIESLREKFNLPVNYFFCPNQFWIHKNHKLILQTIKILKEKGLEIFVAFSGKEYENRNPEHFSTLMKFVEENRLSDNIRFLGFIDRREQLKLMSKATAILQPSLFEGWSTVVEDAKAMNQFIFASNLEVHQEQLDRNYSLFNPDDANDLAQKIELFLLSKPIVEHIDYQKQIKEFGLQFMNIVKEVSKK